MTPEQLAEVRTQILSGMAALLAHVEALEAQLADARYVIAEMERNRCEAIDITTRREYANMSRIHTLESNNAALLGALRDVCANVFIPEEHATAALRADHPGAALLEENQRLRQECTRLGAELLTAREAHLLTVRAVPVSADLAKLEELACGTCDPTEYATPEARKVADRLRRCSVLEARCVDLEHALEAERAKARVEVEHHNASRLPVKEAALLEILRHVEHVESRNPEEGMRYCPMCGTCESGHTEGCALGHALHGAHPAWEWYLAELERLRARVVELEGAYVVLLKERISMCPVCDGRGTYPMLTPQHTVYQESCGTCAHARLRLATMEAKP